MDVQLRLARPEDTGILTDLCIRSKQSNGYDDAFMAACRDELTITSEHLSDNGFWVAESQGTICGCACLGTNVGDRSGQVRNFFIDPPWQRQGVGRLLWWKLITQAKAADMETLYLESDPAAVPFYEALGFEITGEAPSGSIPGRVLPRMAIAVADCNEA